MKDYNGFQRNAALLYALHICNTGEARDMEFENWISDSVPSFLGRCSDAEVTYDFTRILMTERPSLGLQILMDDRLGRATLPWLSYCWRGELYEILRSLQGCTQDPVHHPEGDVYNHTLQVLTHIRPRTALACWSALLHDIGKPTTWRMRDDKRNPGQQKITNYGHDRVGADMSRVFALRNLDWSRCSNILNFDEAMPTGPVEVGNWSNALNRSLAERIARIVENHMRFHQLARRPEDGGMGAEKREKFLKFERDMPTMLELYRADVLGRGPQDESVVLTNYNALKQEHANLRGVCA